MMIWFKLDGKSKNVFYYYTLYFKYVFFKIFDAQNNSKIESILQAKFNQFQKRTVKSFVVHVL